MTLSKKKSSIKYFYGLYGHFYEWGLSCFTNIFARKGARFFTCHDQCCKTIYVSREKWLSTDIFFFRRQHREIDDIQVCEKVSIFFFWKMQKSAQSHYIFWTHTCTTTNYLIPFYFKGVGVVFFYSVTESVLAI